ncbi:MAG: hypothetical protein AAGG44_13460 [Planctomycetota bacterium]
MIRSKRLALTLASLFAVAAIAMAPVADAGHCATDCCVTCCTPPPPPPVSVAWCVVDPCDPCVKHKISACLPACCKCQTPCLAGWKKGFLGRKILTYKFPCGECVEVVLTKRGAKVR